MNELNLEKYERKAYGAWVTRWGMFIGLLAGAAFRDTGGWSLVIVVAVLVLVVAIGGLVRQAMREMDEDGY